MFVLLLVAVLGVLAGAGLTLGVWAWLALREERRPMALDFTAREERPRLGFRRGR